MRLTKTKMAFSSPTASAYLLIGALCILSLPWVISADETSGNPSSVSSTHLEEGSAAGDVEEEKEVEGAGKGQEFSGSLRPDLQKRRNSFRSDLGKRSEPDAAAAAAASAEVKATDKRGPRMKSFRSDLGKRKSDVASVGPPRRLDLGAESGEATRVRACDNEAPIAYGRRRRYAEEEEEEEELEELEDEMVNDRRSADLEKRIRSSFRSDLGRRSVDLSGGFEAGLDPPKRSGHGFRGDLGKRRRSLAGVWWKTAAEAKGKRFRGDLGRKRTAALGDVGSVEFPDDHGDDLRRRFLQQQQQDLLVEESAQGIEDDLEKRRFRSDLG